MRILHLLDHSIPLHSGYSFRTLSILREQRARGWDTVHLTGPRQGTSAGCAEPDLVDGWEFFRTPTPAASRNAALHQLQTMRAIRQRLQEVAARLRPDVIHAHSPVLNALPALAVGRALGLPVVYEVRAFWEDAAVDHGTCREDDMRYRISRAMETWALRRCDAVTTICEGLRLDMVRRRVRPEKITVIPNAVDIGSFAPGGGGDPLLRARLGLGQDRVIGFIGSFYAYEGLSLLLSSLALLRSRGMPVKLVLVGGGPEEATLREQARALGLDPHVRFIGRVPHQEVQAYYDLVDVLAYPRLSMRLTELVTPLKPLEAMAQGRLLVASDVGGHRELIEDGVNGALFRAGDAQSLSASIAELLTDPERAARMKRHGRTFVERERHWAGSVARYAPVYAGVLAGRATRTGAGQAA